MEQISSFTIDHTKLLPGLYVSRKDKVGANIITTFDIRMKRPNHEPVMNTAEMHAIEHLAATFLRNHEKYKDEIVYFGPMGCRTGFYLIVSGDYSSKEILPLIVELFKFLVEFNEDIPGATPICCGNCLDMNLPMAKYEANLFLELLKEIKEENLIYPV